MVQKGVLVETCYGGVTIRVWCGVVWCGVVWCGINHPLPCSEGDEVV